MKKQAAFNATLIAISVVTLVACDTNRGSTAGLIPSGAAPSSNAETTNPSPLPAPSPIAQNLANPPAATEAPSPTPDASISQNDETTAANESPQGTAPGSDKERSSLHALTLAQKSAAAYRRAYGVEFARVAEHDTKGTKTTPGSSPDSGLSRADKKFLEDAAESGLYEVEAAKVGREMARDPAVKSFAQMLETQHTAANDELKQLAAKLNVVLPTEMPTMKRRAIENLRKASGEEFDRRFVRRIGIDDHEKDIRTFEKASKDSTNSDIRSWAGKTLPTLREHLAQARTLPGAPGRSAATDKGAASQMSPPTSYGPPPR